MQKYTDEMMLDELHRVAAIVNRPFGRPLYQQHGRISAAAISARFGSWLTALQVAGLEPAWHAGGLQFICPLCGTMFRSDRSVKSRKYCSDTCSRDAMSRHRVNYRGDAASEHAARGRAARYRKAACEQCGAAPGGRKLHVHHRDHNPYNNDPSNLITLCSECHYAAHPDRVARGAAHYLGARTHCPSGHPYDAANTYITRGRRHCKACKRARDRRRVRVRRRMPTSVRSVGELLAALDGLGQGARDD